MIPFITCEFLLCQDVCKLVLGIDVFDLNLRVKIDSIEQPIKSNSMSSGNMSHCWTSLLPFIIILITASLSSNTYNKASRLADWTFEGTESMSCIASNLL